MGDCGQEISIEKTCIPSFDDPSAEDTLMPVQAAPLWLSVLWLPRYNSMWSGTIQRSPQNANIKAYNKFTWVVWTSILWFRIIELISVQNTKVVRVPPSMNVPHIFTSIRLNRTINLSKRTARARIRFFTKKQVRQRTGTIAEICTNHSLPRLNDGHLVSETRALRRWHGSVNNVIVRRHWDPASMRRNRSILSIASRWPNDDQYPSCCFRPTYRGTRSLRRFHSKITLVSRLLGSTENLILNCVSFAEIIPGPVWGLYTPTAFWIKGPTHS